MSYTQYIDQKIVHCHLKASSFKLENLLLGRHRNVIITGFGFANRFEHKPDELMQTSCNPPLLYSPWARYPGRHAHWICCGYLELWSYPLRYARRLSPFDDDPLDPDGDNCTSTLSTHYRIAIHRGCSLDLNKTTLAVNTPSETPCDSPSEKRTASKTKKNTRHPKSQ